MNGGVDSCFLCSIVYRLFEAGDLFIRYMVVMEDLYWYIIH